MRASVVHFSYMRVPCIVTAGGCVECTLALRVDALTEPSPVSCRAAAGRHELVRFIQLRIQAAMFESLRFY